MRVVTEHGITLGFTRISDTLAEVAFEPAHNTPAIGSILKIDGSLWKVRSIKPSEYVRPLQVASLWLIDQ